MDKRDVKIALDSAFKNEAKARTWRSSGERPYWIEGDAMFRVFGDFNGKVFNFSLRLKSLALDKMLWRVLGFKLDEFKPSLHLNGAYAIHRQTIDAVTVPAGSSAAEIEAAVHAYCDLAQERARQAIEMIGRDGFAAAMDALLDVFAARYPRAHPDASVEKVLWYLMRDELDQAKALILPKIAARDTGGFFVDGSFYERALRYAEATSCVIPEPVEHEGF